MNYESTFGPYFMTPTGKLGSQHLRYHHCIAAIFSTTILFSFHTTLAPYVVWILTDHGGDRLAANLGLLDRPGNLISPAHG